MQAEQTIERYLNDLAYEDNYYRLKSQFQGSVYTQQDAFVIANNQLRGAHIVWLHHRDAVAALTHLEHARDICIERLSRAYLSKYTSSVSYFQGILSRSGTPEVHRDVHMQNLLLRVAACLQ